MSGDHGRFDYVQIPAPEWARTCAFYEGVFGWSVDQETGSFEVGGLIGQLTAERKAVTEGQGPLLWLHATDLGRTLTAVTAHGGRVLEQPQLDGGARWLVLVGDPSGNQIGIATRAPVPQPQTLLAVADVEAASRWYQQLLGLRSDHGGPDYERLLAGDRLVLQLHHRDVEHHHGRIGAPTLPSGNGVLVWFGEVSDFEGVVARAGAMGATVVHPPHRNPPDDTPGAGPGHLELWLTDLDGYTVVIASPDGTAYFA